MHPPTRHPSDTIAASSAALLLVAAMLFGGGPRGMGDLVVHLAAIPALAIGVLRWRQRDASRPHRLFLWWLVAAIALIALQLLPLPASLFVSLPQRAGVLADLYAAGVDRDWLPMTLDTWATVRGLLAILTFAAMWLLASTLPRALRIRLLQLAIAVAVLMALLGFAQAAAGTHAPIRFYSYHHPVGAIGTFANRNHFATLMGMLAPLALAFAAQAQHRRQRALPVWYFIVVVLLLASALSYSRAGFALTCAALAASAVVLFWRGAGHRQRVLPALVGLVAVLAVGAYAWDGLLQRLEQDPLADLRWQYLHYGWEAAKAYLPWGSGLGSFPWAYAPFEPVAAMTSVYAERAHNDLLQTAIESGWPGVVVLAAFIAFICGAALRKIRMERRHPNLDHGVIVAAVIAVFVPLLHSLVDYPLRTLCVATVFALLLTFIQDNRAGDGSAAKAA